MNEADFNDMKFFPTTPRQATAQAMYFSNQAQEVNPFDAEYHDHGFSETSHSDAISSSIGYRSERNTSFDPAVFDRVNSAGPSSSSSSDTPDRDVRIRPMGKRSSTESSGDKEPGEPGSTTKRAKFLERNRQAAAKCRTKKKEWTNNLEAAARQASQQTRELQAIVQNLRDEALNYKSQLMSHQSCDCLEIRQYLMNEQARSFATYTDMSGCPADGLHGNTYNGMVGGHGE